MAVDIEDIGTLGLSFSKGFDQTWFNLWRKEDCFSADFYQDVESDDDDVDDDPIETSSKIPLEEGEALLKRILDEGRVDEWKQAYTDSDEGMDTDLSWTLDIDDLQDGDLFFSSGNGKLPPRDLTMGILGAIRTVEPRFAACFADLAS